MKLLEERKVDQEKAIQSLATTSETVTSAKGKQFSDMLQLEASSVRWWLSSKNPNGVVFGCGQTKPFTGFVDNKTSPKYKLFKTDTEIL